ncbi:MAG TPA: hypothetical protein VF665_06070 [Longimicrobium sp.]|jgi:hypothetical protein|uniref:hypothetical protein n=1 Tax=Longimicrobium sp. TaxID=2029185 RepID=UPI002ED93144
MHTDSRAHRRTRFLVAARISAVLLALSAPRSARAQNEAPELSSLRPPASPAFLLLGVSPTEVHRPTNPADFAFTLVNGTSMLSELPENFALEAAPYWFASRRMLTWQEDNVRSPIQSFWRTLAVTTGSAEIGTDEAPVTGVSVGSRAMLLSGRYSQATIDSLSALQSALASEGGMNLRLAAVPLAALDRWLANEMGKPGANRDSLRAEYNRRRAAIDDAVLTDPAYQKQVKAVRDRFNDFAVRREGHMLEVAGGAAWGFPDRVVDAGRLRRWAGWATYSCERCFSPAGPPLTPVVMVRYQAGEDDVGGDVLDVGASLNASDTRWGLSIEGVWRQFTGGSDADALYRIAGHLEYQVRRDMWLQATFGRDQDTSREGSLLAQLGFRFNFAEERYKP